MLKTTLLVALLGLSTTAFATGAVHHNDEGGDVNVRTSNRTTVDTRNNNSNRNTNTNLNVTTSDSNSSSNSRSNSDSRSSSDQRQDQFQGQNQGQYQGANNDQAQSLTYNESNEMRYSGGYEVKTNTGSYAPSMDSANPCIMGVSAGASAIGGALSFGGYIVDDACVAQNNAMRLTEMGMGTVAYEVMCGLDSVYEADQRSAKQCTERPESTDKERNNGVASNFGW